PAPPCRDGSMRPARTSRRRYHAFRLSYKEGRIEELAVSEKKGKLPPPPKEERRRSLWKYLGWLRPHAPAVLAVLLLAAVNAGLETLPPLFMRYVIDKVLLAPGLETAARF